jgi:hypothetical protein
MATVAAAAAQAQPTIRSALRSARSVSLACGPKASAIERGAIERAWPRLCAAPMTTFEAVEEWVYDKASSRAVDRRRGG